MGNFCARSEAEDPSTIAKVVIGEDYKEFPDKIAGSGVKATPAWQATVTRAQLNQKRDEFWRSRTEGNRRVWMAIKAAVEADPATALSILQNMKIKMKTGNLTILEDDHGIIYSIPVFMINNPLNFHNEKKHKGRIINDREENIKVRIRRAGVGEDEVIEIMNTAKVEELRKIYADKVKVMPCQVRLFYDGKEMKDHCILSALYIEDGVVIMVFLKSL
ncbi:hypothetical protein SteCoe_15363 [Stentor coeruleus]|uniref:Ubiquitin-like domain-containing protein n=1 Tax=Stentor coeruleus TaxID=5963 RepID=A0A1R2C3U4_9CILI|nr:hypothetical protein SteCoe_15363 [Stentor coeruleus]